MNIPEHTNTELKKCPKCKQSLALTLDNYQKNNKREWFNSCNKCRARQIIDNKYNRQFKFEYMSKWMEEHKDKYKDVIATCKQSFWSDMEIYTHIRANYDKIADPVYEI